MTYIVHTTDKRSNITYAYEVTSFWDKDLKKTRSRRKLIGRVDESGEIVPTDGRKRKKQSGTQSSTIEEDVIQLKKKNIELENTLKSIKSTILLQQRDLKELQRRMEVQIAQNQSIVEKL